MHSQNDHHTVRNWMNAISLCIQVYFYTVTMFTEFLLKKLICKTQKFQLVCFDYNFDRSTRLQYMFDEFK